MQVDEESLKVGLMLDIVTFYVQIGLPTLKAHSHRCLSLIKHFV